MGCAALAVSVFGRSVSLDWQKGGDQPVEVIDFGPQTMGGYAVFEVADFTSASDGAFPVLRLVMQKGRTHKRVLGVHLRASYPYT